MLIIGIDTIERHYIPSVRRYWFDADARRFFKSRLPTQAYQTDDESVAYFVTSEQQHGHARRWSVRRYTFATRDISTVGDFQEYSNRSAADRRARYLASQMAVQPAQAA